MGLAFKTECRRGECLFPDRISLLRGAHPGSWASGSLFNSRGCVRLGKYRGVFLPACNADLWLLVVRIWVRCRKCHCPKILQERTFRGSKQPLKLSDLTNKMQPCALIYGAIAPLFFRRRDSGDRVWPVTWLPDLGQVQYHNRHSW